MCGRVYTCAPRLVFEEANACYRKLVCILPSKYVCALFLKKQVLERPRTVSTAKHSYHRSHSPPKRPSTSAASPSSLNILLQSEEDPVRERTQRHQ